jgi:hypothetical protein
VRRALQALSGLYVERRGRLATGAAFEGAGKRAAFALYYGPLHFLLVRHIVRELGAGDPLPQRIVDVGCGTGIAGAAWALAAAGHPVVEGVDRNGWAVDEARWTYAHLGVRGRASRGELASTALPGAGGGVIAAFTVNELDEPARGLLLPRLLESAHAGARVIVVEPISRRAVPWWSTWAAAFTNAGGRADEWRFRAVLPERLALLDRAAGLDHRELTGRSLYLTPGPFAPGARAARSSSSSMTRAKFS